MKGAHSAGSMTTNGATHDRVGVGRVWFKNGPTCTPVLSAGLVLKSVASSICVFLSLQLCFLKHPQDSILEVLHSNNSQVISKVFDSTENSVSVVSVFFLWLTESSSPLKL